MIEVHHGYNAPDEPTRINSYQEFIEENIELEMKNGLLCIKDAYQFDDLQEYIDDIPENFIEKIYSENGKNEALALSKSKHTHVVNSSDIAAKYMLDACCRRLKVIYLSVPFLIDLVAAAERGDIRKRLRYDIKSADVIIWDNVERVHGKWSEFISEKVSDGEKAQHVFIVKDASKIKKKYDNDFLKLLEFETKTFETKPTKKIETKKQKAVEAEVIDFADFKFDRFVKTNEACLLNDFVRSGVFKNISTKERKKLETISKIDGQVIDLPSPEVFEYQGIDCDVRVKGTVLDNTRDLYVALAIYKMYVDQKLNSGILNTSLTEINKCLGMTSPNSASNTKPTRRSLQRLSQCSIEIIRNDITSWNGHIVDEISFFGDRKNHCAHIRINICFLSNLVKRKYQVTDFKILRSLGTYERSIYTFYRSHSETFHQYGLEKAAIFVGIQLPEKNSPDYKKHFKSYKLAMTRAIAGLVKKGHLTADSRIENNLLFVKLTNPPTSDK